jgi:DNA polymerase III epsilon subunit-like protein
MILFFDTETTGLPKRRNAPLTDLDNWPRLVEIGWVVLDNDLTEVCASEFIIKPNGFTVPVEASNVHGITQARAMSEGVDLGPVLDEFYDAVSRSSSIIAHNMDFDEKVIGSEFLRAKKDNLLQHKAKLCTMKSSTDYCALPGRYGNKWPTLGELHRKLFSSPMGKAHNALVDVRAGVKCYRELVNIGVM